MIPTMVIELPPVAQQVVAKAEIKMAYIRSKIAAHEDQLLKLYGQLDTIEKLIASVYEEHKDIGR